MAWAYVPHTLFTPKSEGVITELSLFSGDGGGLLATQHLLGFQTVCYVERGTLQIKTLRKRIEEGYLDDALIWDDVRTFSAKPFSGAVDLVTAGFPCQPYSSPGKRLGAADSRNLWPDTIRIIRESRAPWVLLENVTALLSYRYFGDILRDLSESGYMYRWETVSAFDVGAPHLRDRLWVVAHATNRRSIYEEGVQKVQGSRRRHHAHGRAWWETEPQVGRMADGLARGVGRQLIPLGEGQVPAVVRAAWEMMVHNRWFESQKGGKRE